MSSDRRTGDIPSTTNPPAYRVGFDPEAGDYVVWKTPDKVLGRFATESEALEAYKEVAR